jgi:hypothetical protein
MMEMVIVNYMMYHGLKMIMFTEIVKSVNQNSLSRIW